MDSVMNELWEKINNAQANGLTQFNAEHDGMPIQITMQKTGWYEGYY
jgi:hypothetical protein